MLSQPILFIATSNADQAKDFYQQKLGFSLIHDSPFALVFDAFGTELRVQKVQNVSDASYTQLGWAVADIKAAIKQLTGNGVVLEHYPQLNQDQHGIWQSPDGASVAWFKDPDGNTLSLSQHP